MELERISVSAMTCAFAACGLVLCRRQSPLHAMVVALFVSALVGSFFPLMSLLVPPATWRNVAHLSHEMLVAVQLEYAAWTAGLLMACLIAAQLRWLAPASTASAVSPRRDTRQRDFTVAWGLVLAGALLYAAYVQRVGLGSLTSRLDYAEKYLLSTGLGPLQFGLSMMIAGCLWAEGSGLAPGDKRLFRVLAAAIAVWAIAFISVRTYAMLLALGYLSIACQRRRIELRRVHFGVIAALVLAYVGLESFSLFRDLYRNDFGQALELFAAQGESAIASVVGGSELSHPFITAGEVMHARNAGELAGSSVVDAVRTLVPLSLDGDRPLTLAEGFVRGHYADLASRGVGTAFSLVAEAWLDFGSLAGPFGVGCVFGGLLLWLEHRRRTLPHGALARLAPYLLFLVAVHHRNEIASLLKQVFMLALALLPVWIAADAIRLALARRPARLSREIA